MRCGRMPWPRKAWSDPARRNYYQAEMLTMITINRESNRMLLDVARR